MYNIFYLKLLVWRYKSVPKIWATNYLETTSALANLFPTESILIFTFLSPDFEFTKITKPWILAIPSPDLPVPIISTVYSFGYFYRFRETIASCYSWTSSTLLVTTHWNLIEDYVSWYITNVLVLTESGLCLQYSTLDLQVSLDISMRIVVRYQLI